MREVHTYVDVEEGKEKRLNTSTQAKHNTATVASGYDMYFYARSLAYFPPLSIL